MDSIFIENLVEEGIHGLTRKEQEKAQTFRIDIHAEVPPRCPDTDDAIKTTADYRIMKDVVTEDVIPGERCNLLETLAERIADLIISRTRIRRFTVTIRKLDIWGEAMPGATVVRERLPYDLGFFDFDVNMIVEELIVHGGVAIPILQENYRCELFETTKTLAYKKQPELIKRSGVRQELSSSDVSRHEIFLQLRDRWTELFRYKLMRAGLNSVFKEPLQFNELSVQMYDIDSIGITPHHDSASLINLVCVFVLAGKGNFVLCNDRSGNNPRLLPEIPGSAIFLRAPGFMGSDYRPFHYLNSITERRITLGLRQKLL